MRGSCIRRQLTACTSYIACAARSDLLAVCFLTVAALVLLYRQLILKGRWPFTKGLPTANASAKVNASQHKGSRWHGTPLRGNVQL